MNTLFEKVSTLVEVNVRSLIGQTNRSKNAATFFRHYMAVEQNLIEVERVIGKAEKQMKGVADKGAQTEELLADLDHQVDDALLRGDDAAARNGQQRLNQVKRTNVAYRAQLQELNREREKLLRVRDKLETQFELMQEEKERLQDLFYQYQADQKNSQNGNSAEKVYWVVEED